MKGASKLERCLFHSGGEGRRGERGKKMHVGVFARFIIHKFVTDLHKAAISVQGEVDVTFPPSRGYVRSHLTSQCFELQSATSCGNGWTPGVLLSGAENFAQSPAVKTEDGSC